MCCLVYCSWESFTPENEEQVSHVTRLGPGGKPTEEALALRPNSETSEEEEGCSRCVRPHEPSVICEGSLGTEL